MGNLVKILIFILILSVGVAANNYGLLEGNVYNEEGAPLADAEVVLFDEAQAAVDSSCTDTTGFFSVKLETGKYYITASAPKYVRVIYPNSYQFRSAKLVEIYGSQIKSIEINLDRGGVISGQIYAYDDTLTNFVVTAIKVGSPYDGWSRSGEFKVGEMGGYCLDGLIAGQYIVMITGGSYGTEYYPGVANIDEAEVVEIEQGSGVVDIDFDVERPGYGIVRGIVKTSHDNRAMEGVKIIAYQRATPESDPCKISTFTNSVGLYRFELVSGYYNISAIISSNIIDNDTVQLFYKDKLNCEYATPIDVKPNEVISGIDFNVDISKNYNLHIYGVLNYRDNGMPVSEAKLTALDYYSGEPIGVAYTQYNGAFVVENLVSGTYIVEVTGSGIIPTFWPSVYGWQQAETVELLSTNQILYNGGAITQDYGNSEFEISGIVKGNGIPLEDVRVYAINTDNGSVVYSSTYTDGFYSLSSGLQSGEYEIFADLYGWDGYYYHPNIVLDSIPTVENINFDLSLITLGVEEASDALPEQTSLLGNYPNPFNSSTAIMMTFDSSIESYLEIYNLTGQLVNSIPFSAQPGMNTIIWNGVASNGNKVSSGIYLYKVQNLPAVRKMVLLK